MRKIFLALGFAVLASPLAYARGPATKLAAPSFEDPTNNASMYTTVIGSNSAQKLYTPDQNRDIRRITVYNPSIWSIMHITTWPVNALTNPVNSTITAPATWMMLPSSITGGFGLDLYTKTTFYAVFEAGTSSINVRTAEFWDDPAKRP